MSHLQKQKDELCILSPEQTDPYLARPDDFEVENAREDSDPEFKDALKDSEEIRPA